MLADAGVFPPEVPTRWTNVSPIAVTAAQRAAGGSLVSSARVAQRLLIDRVVELPGANGTITVIVPCFEGDADAIMKASSAKGVPTVKLDTHLVYFPRTQTLVGNFSHPVVVGGESAFSKTKESAKMIGEALGRPLNVSAFDAHLYKFYRPVYGSYYGINFDGFLSAASRMGASDLMSKDAFTSALDNLGVSVTWTSQATGISVAELNHPLPDYETIPRLIVENMKKFNITALTQQDAGEKYL